MKSNEISRFKISVETPQKAKIKTAYSLTFHPIFWQIKTTKEVRKHFFAMCELIDEETGMLSQKFSDGTIVPLSKKQLSIHFGEAAISHSLDELVANGVFAEVSVARTSFYVANPYIVCYGFVCNAYLLNIFNKITLNRYDKYSKLFSKETENEFGKIWGVMNVK